VNACDPLRAPDNHQALCCCIGWSLSKIGNTEMPPHIPPTGVGEVPGTIKNNRNNIRKPLELLIDIRRAIAVQIRASLRSGKQKCPCTFRQQVLAKFLGRLRTLTVINVANIRALVEIHPRVHDAIRLGSQPAGWLSCRSECSPPTAGDSYDGESQKGLCAFC